MNSVSIQKCFVNCFKFFHKCLLIVSLLFPVFKCFLNLCNINFAPSLKKEIGIKNGIQVSKTKLINIQLFFVYQGLRPIFLISRVFCSPIRNWLLRHQEKNEQATKGYNLRTKEVS